MKILILGGDGMLGHQLLLTLQSKFEVKVTLRLDFSTYEKYGIFTTKNSFYEIDIRNFEKLRQVISVYKPDVIINAIGIVKQREDSKDILQSIEINTIFPHKLALLCQENNIRLIHISTDCVFSGKSGKYTEESISDAEDIYGRSKYLGEVRENKCITLRTSIIGRALNRHDNLLDWFFQQKNQINGYEQAIFSGITTLELSKIIEIIINKFPESQGLFHVSSTPISKLDLLKLTSDIFKQNIAIIPDKNFKCDRSLCSSLFAKTFGYKAPSWHEMITDFKHQTIINKNLYQNAEK